MPILNSIRSKVALIFVAFGLLFAIEGAIVIRYFMLASNAGKQIEVATESGRINHESYTNFEKFIAGNESAQALDYESFSSEAALLDKLYRGGRLENLNIAIPPAPDRAVALIEKLVDQQATQSKAWLKLVSQKAAYDSLRVTHSGDTVQLLFLVPLSIVHCLPVAIGMPTSLPASISFQGCEVKWFQRELCFQKDFAKYFQLFLLKH